MTGPDVRPPVATTWTAACDRAIEACWLVALVTVPVFFDGQTAAVFELAKAGLLRTLALVMLACWVIKWLERLAGPRSPTAAGDRGSDHAAAATGEGLARPLGGAVVGFAIALFAWQCLSGVFSISPPLSVWGSHDRAQGLVTNGAWLIMFLSMTSLIKTRRQVNRVVLAMLLASCPIAVYGLLQHAGLDPVVWGRRIARPVTSTMGNAIFLAAYLLMVAPLTVWRMMAGLEALVGPASAWARNASRLWALLCVVVSISAWSNSPTAGVIVCLLMIIGWSVFGWVRGGGALPGAAVGALAVLLSLQLAALLHSESRGPFLGLLSGGFIFIFLTATLRGRWRLKLGVIAGGLVVVAALAAINVPGSPLAAVKELPVIGRLTGVFETGGSARVRLLLWQQSVDTFAADAARLATGYGPETTRLAMAPHHLPELGTVESRGVVADRAHNETYDRLITGGLVSLGLYFSLLLAAFGCGLSRLGVLASRRALTSLLLTCGATALSFAGLALVADGSWRLVGVALPLGLLGGVVLYLAGVGYARRRSPPIWDRGDPTRLACVAFLSALAGYFVETQFGIPTVSTQTCFFACLALLVVAGRGVPANGASSPAVVPREGSRHLGAAGNEARLESVLGLALFALCVLTLSFDFVSSGADPFGAWPLLMVPIVSWLLIVAAAAPPEQTGRQGPEPITAKVPGAIGFGLPGGVILVTLLLPGLLAGWPDTSGVGLHAVQSAYLVLLVLLLVSIAVCLPVIAGRARPAPGRRQWLVYSLALVLTVPAGWLVSLRPLQADVAYKQGRAALLSRKDVPAALTNLRRARDLAPFEPLYATYLSRVLGELATGARDERLRDGLYAEAVASLTAIRRQRPSDFELPLNLARTYARWSGRTSDPDARAGRMETALAYFAEARSLSPMRPTLLNAYGTAYALNGQHDAAIAQFERALALDPELADTYVLLARSHGSLGNPDAARRIIQQGFDVAEPTADLYHAAGRLDETAGRHAEAMLWYERSLAEDESHRGSHAGIFRLTLRSGDCEAARGRLGLMEARFRGDRVVAQSRIALANRCTGKPGSPNEPQRRR